MICDCFIFFNELELLKVRLYELDPVVDKFILIEAGQTFTGIDKPLFYKENMSLFEQWNKKIVHIALPNLIGDDAWSKEKYQRNAALDVIKQHVSPDDIFMLSDVDEIPKREIIENIHDKVKGLTVLTFDLFYFYLNVKCAVGLGSRLIRFGDLLERDLNPQSMRELVCSTQMTKGKFWKSVGWHFSFMGGAEKIKQKLQSFSHQEYNIPEYTNIDKINNKMFSENIDPVGRICTKTTLSINDMPHYIKEHPEEFKNWLK